MATLSSLNNPITANGDYQISVAACVDGVITIAGPANAGTTISVQFDRGDGTYYTYTDGIIDLVAASDGSNIVLIRGIETPPSGVLNINATSLSGASVLVNFDYKSNSGPVKSYVKPNII